MRMIISPAKKMKIDTDSFPCRGLPQFLSQTKGLHETLRGMTGEELQALWKCNAKIVALNMERLRTLDLERALTPAILAYEGIQYQHMAPGVFSQKEVDYVEEHLRILSGFYGVLRPFDGVIPYRLEMQTKLSVGDAKDLYAYWGNTLAEAIQEESDLIVDLASKEYSRCISQNLRPETRLITCVFGQRQGEKIVEKGTLCKMARGEMVRFLAERQSEDPETMKDFDRLGYHFSPEDSNETKYTFIKET